MNPHNKVGKESPPKQFRPSSSQSKQSPEVARPLQSNAAASKSGDPFIIAQQEQVDALLFKDETPRAKASNMKPSH